MIKQFALGAAALALLAACGPAATDTEEASELTIVTENGFVMEPIAGRDITMGGVGISVTGQDVRLVRAEAEFAETIELHTMSMEDGQMQMRQVEGFDVADGDSLQLERGGNHLMFFGLDGLSAGETETIQLVFETGDGEEEVVNFQAIVRAVGE